MDRSGVDDAWYDGRAVPSARFRHNETVRVINGVFAGQLGVLVTVESLEPEPQYLVELASGDGDVLLPDSSLARVE